MSKIKEFLKLITSDQYIGWVLLGIFVLVILVFISIVTNYQAKKKKAETDARNYKIKEITSLSDEEVKNIANNVSDPELLYQKLEEQEQKVKAEIEKTKTKVSVKEDATKTQPEPTKKTTTTKKTTKKPESADATKKVVKEEAPKKVVYTGKWKIKQEDGKYFAELIASNGVIVLKTEYYTSLTGVKNGIETIK